MFEFRPVAIGRVGCAGLVMLLYVVLNALTVSYRHDQSDRCIPVS